MSKISIGKLGSGLLSRSIRRWARVARNADQAELAVLRQQSTGARTLKTHLDRLIHTADKRLALAEGGAQDFDTPHNADWAWRPALWQAPMELPGRTSLPSNSKLDDNVTLFHDCASAELTLRQLRNAGKGTAPLGMSLEVYQFEGSFLSLVVDVPEAGIANLKRAHILQIDFRLELETPLEVFARLNIKSGPNTEQTVRELETSEEIGRVEFDLAYSQLNEKRVEGMWIDLIFENPQMNQIFLRDLTFSRRPRAQF